MRYFLIMGMALIVSLLLLLPGCSKKEEVETAPEGSVSTPESGGNQVQAAFSVPELAAEYWKTLFETQQAIMASPEDAALRKQLCDKAYFPQNRAIVAVGVGRRSHPETGQPISPQFVRQAAYTDAARWAGYISAWLEQNYQPNFGELSKALDGSSQVISETVLGDSLYVEVAYQY